MEGLQVQDKFIADEIALRNTIQRDFTDIRGYEGDYKLYEAYCTREGKAIGEKSLLHYLHHSLTEQKVKKNTFNRRYFAVKKILEINGIELSEEHSRIVKRLRRQYASEEYAIQSRVEGKNAVNSRLLLNHIRSIEDIRAKAILFTQFYTANRPSEMVLLQVHHFNLNKFEVEVYLKKQRKQVKKNLTEECVDAIIDYIQAYDLKPNDYFIGQLYKNGRYVSKEISTTAYYKQLTKWSEGYTAYNFRKSLVSHMHRNGASVEVIQQQTGHSNTQTILQHYLEVDKEVVNRYL